MRDQVKTGAVRFEWIPTNEMAADGLTKALTNDKFASGMVDSSNMDCVGVGM